MCFHWRVWLWLMLGMNYPKNKGMKAWFFFSSCRFLHKTRSYRFRMALPPLLSNMNLSSKSQPLPKITCEKFPTKGLMWALVLSIPLPTQGSAPPLSFHGSQLLHKPWPMCQLVVLHSATGWRGIWEMEWLEHNMGAGHERDLEWSQVSGGHRADMEETLLKWGASEESRFVKFENWLYTFHFSHLTILAINIWSVSSGTAIHAVSA